MGRHFGGVVAIIPATDPFILGPEVICLAIEADQAVQQGWLGWHWVCP
ncbi:hypothetical protein KQ305_06845 [Synechococcus sp. CS-1332]|nr:hypothetical protein [Synechococcus sp. CS-1332]